MHNVCMYLCGVYVYMCMCVNSSQQQIIQTRSHFLKILDHSDFERAYIHTIMNPTSSIDGTAISGIKYLRDVQNLKLRMQRRIIFVCPLPAPTMEMRPLMKERDKIMKFFSRRKTRSAANHLFGSVLPGTSRTPQEHSFLSSYK